MNLNYELNIKAYRHQINKQIAFCTDKGLKTLKFIKSYEVKK